MSRKLSQAQTVVVVLIAASVGIGLDTLIANRMTDVQFFTTIHLRTFLYFVVTVGTYKILEELIHRFIDEKLILKMTLYRLISEDPESGAEVGNVVSVSDSEEFEKRAKSEYKRVEKLKVDEVL